MCIWVDLCVCVCLLVCLYREAVEGLCVCVHACMIETEFVNITNI